MTCKCLNLDVLAIICEFLAVSDILSFALTCSSLRPLATGRLLSMRPIHLESSENIRQLHRFVFVDAHTRTPHIRALIIDSEDPQVPPLRRLLSQLEPHDMSLLLEILTSCTCLESLEIGLEDDSQRVSSGLPIINTMAIIDAIAGIQSLRSLTVYGGAANALKLFRKIHAPLCMVGIQCGSGDGDSEELNGDPATLEMFLSQFAPTLEKLELYDFMGHSAEVAAYPVTVSTASATQYPSVRSLSIEYIKPLLHHLLRIFPGLDGTLSLCEIPPLGWIDEAECLSIRAANLRAQLITFPRRWKKLDRVVCDPLMLFVLALRCPIRLVMLDRCYPRTNHFAAEALRENPVPRLKLTLHLEDRLSLLHSVFSPELARKLTHLTVCLLYAHEIRGPWARYDSRTVKPDHIIEAICSALKPLDHLTHLRIIVHATVYGDTFSSPHVKEFVRGAREYAFDFDGTAALFVRRLPSLQFLCVTTSGHFAPLADDKHTGKSYERWNTTKAWRVTERPRSTDARQDSEPALVGLHEDVAETIIRKEELVISHSDEMSMRIRDD